jgi:hypothetical protein
MDETLADKLAIREVVENWVIARGAAWLAGENVAP